MYKSSTLWLSLCLSSLVMTVSLVAGTSARTFATPNEEISQLNACAGKNPCASANPCAGKQENVGGPLARKLQGKPVVVDIYASWCSACKNIAPTMSELKEEYAGKAHFVVLDVSDKSKAAESARQARELGLSRFFEANKSQTGMVAIIDPDTGNLLIQHRNNANKSAYTSVLNSALSQK